MNFAEAQQYLLSLGHETIAIKLGLENIRILLSAFGDPHRSYPSVHVAGTNGKGSVAATIESIARTAGLRTGLYTSPHLISMTERIRVDGEEIAETDFARLTTSIVGKVEQLRSEGKLQTPPTFFEHLTAIAMLYFQERSIELGIFEVGLGGRLDATNVLEPLVAVITPVDFDHQQYLGSTLAEIAAEKAAILKPGSAAVIAPQRREANEVIMGACIERNLLPVFLDSSLECSATGDGRYSFSLTTTDSRRFEDVVTGLRGRHQAFNAATAIEACEALRRAGMSIEDEAIRRGIRDVRWPGRIEIQKGKPEILLDGAHNQLGARTLRDFLIEYNRTPVTLLFGAMADKDIDSIAREIFPIASTLVLTHLHDRRAATLERLGQAGFAHSQNVVLVESVRRAFEWALRSTPPEGLLVVTGSLYLVGEVKRILEGEPPDL